MGRLADIMPVGQEGSAVWRNGLSGKVTCVAVGQGCEYSVRLWCPMDWSLAYQPTQPWLPRHRTTVLLWLPHHSLRCRNSKTYQQ